jgi:hypothetical protein
MGRVPLCTTAPCERLLCGETLPVCVCVRLTVCVRICATRYWWLLRPCYVYTTLRYPPYLPPSLVSVVRPRTHTHARARTHTRTHTHTHTHSARTHTHTAHTHTHTHTHGARALVRPISAWGLGLLPRIPPRAHVHQPTHSTSVFHSFDIMYTFFTPAVTGVTEDSLLSRS